MNTYTQTVSEDRVKTFDFSQHIGATDTINSATVTLGAGSQGGAAMTNTTAVISGQQVQLRFRAGAAGNTYKHEILATSASGIKKALYCTITVIAD